MRNKDIRDAMKAVGLSQWRLGELLGVSENTVNRKLRQELPDDEKRRILRIIKDAAKR